MSDREYKHRPLSDEVKPDMQRDLVRVMEECAELSQIAAKILRFGPDNWHPKDKAKTTNTALLRREVSDLAEALWDLGEPFPREFANPNVAPPASQTSEPTDDRVKILEADVATYRAIAQSLLDGQRLEGEVDAIAKKWNLRAPALSAPSPTLPTMEEHRIVGELWRVINAWAMAGCPQSGADEIDRRLRLLAASQRASQEVVSDEDTK